MSNSDRTPRTYLPLQNGLKKDNSDNVRYKEFVPDASLSNVVYTFWELKSVVPLKEDFAYTIMPDACIDLIFSLSMKPKALPVLTTPHVASRDINLGASFHHIGIRFYPGVFTELAPNISSIVGNELPCPSLGSSDLEKFTSSLEDAPESEHVSLLNNLVFSLLKSGYVASDILVAKTIDGLLEGKSVEIIAQTCGYSTRQLRRVIRKKTGFSPMQLYRVIRFQLALSSNEYLLRFADQAHLIKEFNAITGSSHRAFLKRFN